MQTERNKNFHKIFSLFRFNPLYKYGTIIEKYAMKI
jgi:hypothetical protein